MDGVGSRTSKQRGGFLLLLLGLCPYFIVSCVPVLAFSDKRCMFGRGILGPFVHHLQLRQAGLGWVLNRFLGAEFNPKLWKFRSFAPLRPLTSPPNQVATWWSRWRTSQYTIRVTFSAPLGSAPLGLRVQVQGDVDDEEENRTQARGQRPARVCTDGAKSFWGRRLIGEDRLKISSSTTHEA